MNLINLGIVVFLCNLAPIFAPPTWSILVYFIISHDLNTPLVVLIGAVAAGFGRYLLALGTRLLRNYIPVEARKNLFDAGRVFEENRKRKFGLLTLFVISPLPSAQLFEAAGLMQMNLKRLTLAFFSGRIVTYSIYATSAAKVKESDFGKILSSAFTSPYAWALELLSIALIYLFAKVDWRRFLRPTSL